MAEGLVMLCVLGVVVSIVLFYLVVRFLWIVPNSLRSISSCLWTYCDILVSSRLDEKDNFENDVDLY